MSPPMTPTKGTSQSESNMADTSPKHKTPPFTRPDVLDLRRKMENREECWGKSEKLRKYLRGLSQITFALGVGRWSEKRVVYYIKSAN